jgi:hypothetical protein
MEERSMGEDDKMAKIKDPEWKRFRKAQLDWYKKTLSIQF